MKQSSSKLILRKLNKITKTMNNISNLSTEQRNQIAQHCLNSLTKLYRNTSNPTVKALIKNSLQMNDIQKMSNAIILKQKQIQKERKQLKQMENSKYHYISPDIPNNTYDALDNIIVSLKNTIK